MTLRRLLAAFSIPAAILSAASVAVAQSGPAAPRPARFEVNAGLLLVGGAKLGSQTGSLTANDPGAPGYTLFRTSTDIGAGTGVEARIGVALTRALSIEGSASWVRQQATTSITGDAEGAAATSATATLDAYQFEGAAVIHFNGARFAGGRGVPFVLAGGGYRRQLDDVQILVATGGYVTAGGGVKYYFVERPKRRMKRLGLRVDGRLTSGSGVFDPQGDGSRTTWSALMALVVGL